jgi:hypothetical protein
MFVETTKVSRQITLSALVLHKAIAQATLASCKRLHVPEGGPLEALGANDFLEAKVREAITANDDKVEVTETAAKHWRAALGVWASIVVKRDEQCQLLTLASDAHVKEKAAQVLLDQLQEQLGLALMSIDDLVGEGKLAKPEKAPKDDSIVSAEAAAAPAEETDAEFAKGTSPAPHRGPPSAQPKAPKAAKLPKTAGARGRGFIHPRGDRGLQ